ncbi:MAG: carbohydrate ABC transporter permease [Chloroflexota bacterium]|jgi:ABC-type glycerol-3-phosphate transport system permease component
MKTTNNIIRIALISALLMFVLFPLYWMFVGTFKTTGEHFTDPPKLLPPRISFDAYSEGLANRGGKGLLDSFIIATSTMILSVGLGSLGAYAIGRYKWGGKNLIFILLAIQMLPPVSLALPLFLMFNKLNIVDTYPALIICDTCFNLPYAIWLLQGFFEEIPIEIEEAARVDGSSRWQIFTQMVLPLSLPGIIAVAFFTFIFAWNEFILAYVFARTKVTPLTVVIPTMVNADTIRWEQVYAVSIIAVVPVIILSLFLQKYLIRGLTFGAVKG